MKKYNTPHRYRVIKTRLTEEEYAEFSEREYWAKRKGQAALDKENASHAATGELPKQTKFETFLTALNR